MLSLAKNPNIDSIYNSQIPKGLKLSDMEGYCPGMDGEVQLHYYLKSSPTEIVVSDWVEVDNKKDFTYQWNLSDLKPGGSYRLKISVYVESSYPGRVSRAQFLQPMFPKRQRLCTNLSQVWHLLYFLHFMLFS